MAGKRNAHGAGTIRQRSDGRWEGRFTVGYDSGTGKQKQQSIYGKTQAEVRKALQLACTSVDNGTYRDPIKTTLGEWLETWLEAYTGNLKPSTKSLYKRHSLKIIKPALGAVKLSALNAPTIQTFINCMQRGDKERKPLAPKSIKNIHGILHKALEKAVELGYIPMNPSSACTLPRIEKPLLNAFDSNDIQKFMSALKGHKFELALLFTLFTGIRQGELIGLTWDCINFEKGSINLYRQLPLIDGVYSFQSLKNDKTRRIVPGKFVMDLLRKQKKTQNEWRLKAGEAWIDEHFVFTNELGQHLARQTLYKAFKAVALSIGLPDMRFHDLRHSYAVTALRSGSDIKTIQENLGHYTPGFTLNVYGHVTEEMRQSSADGMDQFINTITSK